MEKTRHNRPKMHGMELEFKMSCVMWPRKVVFLTVLLGRIKISIFVDLFFIYVITNSILPGFNPGSNSIFRLLCMPCYLETKQTHHLEHAQNS